MCISKLTLISIPFISLSLILGSIFQVQAQPDDSAIEATEEETQIDIGSLPVPESGINMTVTPISLTLNTDPGVPVTSAIKIRNNGNETEYIRPEIATFDASGENGTPVIKPLKPEDTFDDWLTFDQEIIQVRPGEWQTVVVNFDPPAEAALDYYYMLLFKRAQEVPVEGTTSLTGAPAIFVLAKVNSPNAIQELQLEEFSVPKIFFEFLPVPLQLRIKNTGNTYLAPTGNVFIDGNGKKDIAVLSINPQNSYILPDSEREFSLKWTEGFPLKVRKEQDGTEVKNGKNETVYQLDWDFSQANKFRIGKYTANLIMVYDNGERDVPAESQVSFWVIPWRLIAVAIAIPVTPAVLVYLFMKWHLRKKEDD